MVAAVDKCVETYRVSLYRPESELK